MGCVNNKSSKTVKLNATVDDVSADDSALNKTVDVF